MKKQLFATVTIVLVSTTALLAGLWPGEGIGSNGSRPALAAEAPAAATDFLAFVEAQYDGIGLADATAVAVSSDGNHVYVAGAEGDAVVVFSRNGTSGALTFVEVQRDDADGVDGLDSANSVAISPDGSHVYVTGLNDDAVAVFSRNGTSGALTFVEVQRDGVGGVDGLDGANSVAVSPDGSHVYVTGGFDNTVAVFSRNGATGALTFVEMEQDGVGGVDGLGGANSVAIISPGGNHVYVASYVDDAVAVFSRNGTSGALTFVEIQQDGVGGVDGLDAASSVAISPDGNHVYVTGPYDDAVAVFSRNGTTGALTFVERKKDGFDGVDGLDSANSVAVSPDGSHVYVTGRIDDAVAVFSRNVSDGKLTFGDAAGRRRWRGRPGLGQLGCYQPRREPRLRDEPQ